MVLAPCAVAHAANASTHHGTMKQSADHTLHGMLHLESKGLLHQHAQCDSDRQQRDQNHCASDCGTLQRVTSQSLFEAHWPKLEMSFSASIVLGRGSHTAPDVWSQRVPELIPVVSRQDAKSVLQSTARLRF